MNARILIVDDNEPIRRLVARTLAGQGYACRAAEDARSAREWLAAEAVDLLISDIVMPGESGIDLVRFAALEYPHLALLMLTGVQKPESAALALELGVDGYLTKPFEKSQLVVSVHLALRHRALEMERRQHREELEKRVEERTRELRRTVTHLEATRQELQKATALFQGLFANARVGIAICAPGPDGGDLVFVDFNPAAELLDGRRRDSLVHRPVREVFPETERLGLLEWARQVARTGRPEHHLIPIPMKDRSVWRDYYLYRLPTGEVATFYTDETERIQAELKLREQYRFIQNLMESIPNPIFYKGTDGRFLGCNSAFAGLLGRPPEDIVGRTALEVAPPDLAEGYMAVDRELLERTGSRQVETQVQAADGSRRDIILTKTSYTDAAGAIAGVVGVVMDISERKRMEERLLRKHKALKATQADLEARNRRLSAMHEELQRAQQQTLQQEKMASIGQLAAGVAHEINNPTGFVSSNLKSLEDYLEDFFGLLQGYRDLRPKLEAAAAGEAAERLAALARREAEMDLDYLMGDTRDLIRESREGTERIKKIVIDLKDFAHPGQHERAPADLNRNLDSVLNIVWNELKYKAAVHKDYGELPPVECYPQQLNQVFMNLLVNAGQAMERQGDIHIATRAVDGGVEVRIRDTGCGIPAAHLPRVFDPFFTTKPVGKGTGLGLNVAYNIVRKHGGRISVESRVGEGTTFTVRLPLLPEGGSAGGLEAEGTASGASHAGTI